MLGENQFTNMRLDGKAARVKREKPLSQDMMRGL